MSLQFKDAESGETINVKTTGLGNHVIMLGDIDISMVDFCHIARYVLTNTDLRGVGVIIDDPRKALIEDAAKMRPVAGFNPTALRLEIQE